ncbi:MAG: hypothetical protein HGB10_01955 [Coriobacteriia bacterium]|nr:hypothetical protein [Coriobacteriia bacterium]
MNEWPLETLYEWEVIEQAGLAVTLSEAERYFAYLGIEVSPADADAIHEASGGHAALLAILATQVATYGVGQLGVRTTSLEAWLERHLASCEQEGDIAVLALVALLGKGTTAEIKALGETAAGAALDRLTAVMPLLSVSSNGFGSTTFRVHDLLSSFVLERFGFDLPSGSRTTMTRVIDHLSARGDAIRAADLMVRGGRTDGLTAWLEEHGSALLSSGAYEQLRTMVELAPVHELMANPRVLLLWAELCAELGESDESLARCNAVRSLSDHEGDAVTSAKAVSLSLQCYCRLQRFEDAERVANEVLSSRSAGIPAELRGEALIATARARLTRGGTPEEVRAVLEEACVLTAQVPEGAHIRYTAATLLALVPILSDGDWMAGTRVLSPLVGTPQQLISSRVIVMGNLGLMLLEAGRLHRSLSLLRAALDEARRFGLYTYTGAYAPPLGCAEVAAGHVEEGIRRVYEGIDTAEANGESNDSAIDRVYLAVILRASGQLEEALEQAEVAFEQLSVADNLLFRRLAALEVAASLLALGDESAARAWTESVAAEGARPNSYHRLRSDMILAEVDRREGDFEGALARLRRNEEYILSENPNWQVAMYCRAFPELLGLFTAALGPDRLPVHMLRMILPEQAEVILGRVKPLLDTPTWRALGARLLGDDEFAKYLERGGLPLCHVRMFGGLEVSIGGRSVRERDWRKRKARVLFAMLMLRRGQDVAREQIFEHLWPEMDEERAKSNLYVVWSTMKSVLMGPDAEKGAKCPYVESVGGVCRSIRSTVRTDVDAFESACATAHAAEADGDRKTALASYRQIADLYRGDLLPGDCYEDWFGNLRDHYRHEFMDAMLRATDIHLEDGDPHTALIFARKALQHDQFREDLYQAAVRCQIAAGQRSSAIDTYLLCRDRLCEELGLDPSPEMRALYDQILAMEDRPTGVDFDPLAD